MAYITPEEVIRFTGVKPSDFRGFEKTNDDKLEELINTWISQAESLINSYCHRKFESNFEHFPAIQNVCLRISANIIALAQARKDTPIIQKDNWSIQAWITSDIFSDDIKADLEPFKVDYSNKSDKIDFFAITGEDIRKW